MAVAGCHPSIAAWSDKLLGNWRALLISNIYLREYLPTKQVLISGSVSAYVFFFPWRGCIWTGRKRKEQWVVETLRWKLKETQPKYRSISKQKNALKDNGAYISTSKRFLTLMPLIQHLTIQWKCSFLWHPCQKKKSLHFVAIKAVLYQCVLQSMMLLIQN